jgi:hypothetical protein
MATLVEPQTKLSTFGGDGVTAIDLSATHEFASQAQLNDFFAGLDALDGTGAMANKDLLQNLTLKLVAGNFGAASARVGYTGSGAVTNLNANINVTVQRNGAINGAGLESALVTVDHSDIDAISTADGVTVDNTDAVDVDNLSSSAEWLEYLNNTLTAAGAAYTLDLTAVGLQLQAGTSATEATALFNALQALDSTLKAKVDTIKIKLAAGNHGADFTINPDLAGFTSLASFIVDATDTLNGPAQSTVGFGFTNAPGTLVTNEARITALASVDLNNDISWGYYLNYLKAMNGDIVSIDLSTRDLADTDSGTTQPYVDAFFSALNAHADKATVKDIYLNISGVDTLALNVGTGSAGLTALTSLVIKGNTSMFTAVDDVAAADLTVISSATGTLGNNGTTAQWKGYLAYLLEDAAHGGAYTGSDPIALNLSAVALNIDAFAPFSDLETAISELPARLKARISAILIKTTNANVDYTNTAAYEFGDAFTAAILAELSALKLVIIDASECTGTKPVFDTAGTFFGATAISKIVY